MFQLIKDYSLRPTSETLFVDLVFSTTALRRVKVTPNVRTVKLKVTNFHNVERKKREGVSRFFET